MIFRVFSLELLSTVECDEMESDWIRQESKSRPGKFYYYNKLTHHATWKTPEELKVKLSGGNDKAKKAVPSVNGVQPTRALPCLSLNSASKQSAEKSVRDSPTELKPLTPLEKLPSLVPATMGQLHLNKSNNSNNFTGILDTYEEDMEVERWGDSEIIDMDVDMTEEEEWKFISEIQTTRTALPMADSVEGLTQQSSSTLTSTKLYLVLDTNILLAHLGFLRELKDYAIKDVGRPVLIIPWVVMQELDALKTRPNQRLADKARDAIRLLHDSFAIKHPRVRGQTMEEVQTELKNIAISNNDDRILHCCLFYQELVRAHNGMVVLFSNDIHLCGKAMVNNVRALNRKTLLTELRALFKNGAVPPSPTLGASPEVPVTPSLVKVDPVSRAVLEDVLCEAESVVGQALSTVIHKEMVGAYQELWETIVTIKPPWQFKDTIRIIEKHWVAVFRAVLPPHLMYTTIPALTKHVSQRDKFIPTTSGVLSFIKTSLELLGAFAAESGYDGVLPQSVAALTELGEKLTPKSMGTVSAATPKHVVSPLVTRSFQSPPSLPLITSLLRPSCGDILSMTGEVPTNPLEQLRWTLEVIVAVAKHCHSRTMLTVQNNPNSLSDRQEACVFLSQLLELLQPISSAVNRLLTSDTNVEGLKLLIQSFDMFLKTTLQKNCPLSCDGFISCIPSNSAEVQKILVQAFQNLNQLTSAVQQLTKDIRVN